MAYANPRVEAFSQYLMRDDQPRKGAAGRALLGLRDRAADVEGQEEAGLHGVHAPARGDALRLQRRAVGPRPPGARADEVTIEHRIGKGRWKRLTALTTAGVYGFRADHRAKQRYRAVDAAGRRHASPARRSGAY